MHLEFQYLSQLTGKEVYLQKVSELGMFSFSHRSFHAECSASRWKRFALFSKVRQRTTCITTTFIPKQENGAKVSLSLCLILNDVCSSRKNTPLSVVLATVSTNIS